MALLDDDRLFPSEPVQRDLARDLYEGVRDLPIISPHGHTDPRWFAEDQPFPDPAQLFVTPDHYVFRMLASQGVSAEESEPYRKALDSDEALVAVYNFYRAIPLWARERLDPVSMPTMFIWPTGSQNVAGASIEANAKWVKGPYRLEIVADVHQPA
ncbi:MAG: glucuronate isomerase, partial [Paracoccus sp. (in: a-proteobacteria)]